MQNQNAYNADNRQHQAAINRAQQLLRWLIQKSIIFTKSCEYLILCVALFCLVFLIILHSRVNRIHRVE